MVDGISGFPQESSWLSGAKDTLILRPGQILPGTVLEVTPENALVLLNGINVVAELTTTVLPGERLMLQVVGEQPDGKVLLQKVFPGQEQGESPVTPKDLEAILSHLEIKNSKLNEAIVKELLQLKIPVTRSTVELLASFALKNNVSPGEVPALAWLWSRSLPITRESMAAMISLMEGGAQDTKMAELLQSLRKIPAGSTPEIPSGGTAAREAAGNFVREAIEQLLLKPEEPRGQWAQKLVDALEKLGLGHERDTLRLLEQVGKQPEGFRDVKDLAGSLKGEEGRTLKAALMEMLKPGGQLRGEDARAANQLVNGVLKDITGFQLLNIAGRQEGDGITTFIPGWITQENDLRPFFLKVKKYYGGSGAPETDYQCQVLFFISTRDMGEVMCRLALENSRLTCGFTVRGEEERRLLDSLLPVLQERMAVLPWKTEIYPSKISGSEEILQTWHEETFAAPENRFRGLDTRI